MTTPTIVDMRADQILDSRGWPTLQVEVVLSTGHRGVAAVPAGASTGSFEAKELRDGELAFGGRGVHRAQAIIHEEIRPGLMGWNPFDQTALDQWMIAQDGTPQKSRWGANTILGVSLAVAHAAAEARGIPLYQYWSPDQSGELPTPQFNLVNGGIHADNALAIQEFLLIPGGASCVTDAVQMGVEIYHALKGRLQRLGYRTAVGDEGGFAPDIDNPEAVFDLLMTSIADAGYRPGRHVALGIDVAANSIRQGDHYLWQGQLVDADYLIGVYQSWARQYPLISVEDGLAEDDWAGWAHLTQSVGSTCQIVGDDIFVTHSERVARGIQEHSANSVLIKLNQVGTVSETQAVLRMVQAAGWTTVVSHRSGETSDTSLVDLAVALRAGQVKAGAPQRGERVAKYNRLLLLEAHDPKLSYAGWRWRTS